MPNKDNSLVWIGTLGFFGLLLLVMHASHGPPKTHAEQSDLPVAQPPRAPAPDLSLPNGPLGAEHILAYLRAYKAFTPKDQFSEPFNDHALIGRRFALSYLYPASDDHLYYQYDIASRTLLLSVTAAKYVGWSGDYVNFLPLEEHKTTGSTKQKSNAFGATADVTEETDVYLGIGSTGKRMGVLPMLVDTSSLDKKIKMSSEQARAAAAGIRVIYEGKITSGKGGNAIACAFNQTSGTITNPIDLKEDACVVSAVFDHIAIISPSAGVLAEWKTRH